MQAGNAAAFGYAEAAVTRCSVSDQVTQFNSLAEAEVIRGGNADSETKEKENAR